MRLAFLGCVHGNLPALEAVLQDAEAQGVDRVFCLGDLVGWGPSPREALARVRGRGIVSIRGHDERRVLDMALGPRGGHLPRPARSIQWTLGRLAPADLDAVAAWPLTFAFEAGPRTVVLQHASADEAIDEDASDRRLEAMLLRAGADVLVMAHAHVTHARTIGSRVALNVGSVGRPFDGDPRAAYAIVDVPEKGAPRVTFRRVVHDLAPALAAAGAAGFPVRARAELAARAERLEAWEAGDVEPFFISAVHRSARGLRVLAERALRRAGAALQDAGRRGLEKEGDVEATHDLRVATRRLVAALATFRDLLPSKRVARVERDLRRIRRRLGESRELDVGREVLDGLASLDPHARGAALAVLERARTQADAERWAALELAAAPRLARRLEHLAALAGRSERAPIARALDALAADVRDHLGRALAPDATDDTRHACRIAAKKLRYALETVGSIDRGAHARARAIQELQDHLGEARDRVVLAHRLEADAQDLRRLGQQHVAEVLERAVAAARSAGAAATAAFEAAATSPRAQAALAPLTKRVMGRR